MTHPWHQMGDKMTVSHVLLGFVIRRRNGNNLESHSQCPCPCLGNTRNLLSDSPELMTGWIAELDVKGCE